MSLRSAKAPAACRLRFALRLAGVVLAMGAQWGCGGPETPVQGPGPIPLVQGWSYARVSASGELGPFQSLDPSHFPLPSGHFPRGSRIVLRLVLPSTEVADPGLYLTGVLEVFEVVVDGRWIYRFGMNDSGTGSSLGDPWHIIPLPPGSAGQTVEFRVYSELPDVGVYGRALYGSRSDLYVHVVQASATQGVLGVFFLLLSIFIVFVFLPSPSMRTYSLAFAAFLFVMGLYVASRTPVRLLIIPYSEFWLWTNLFSLYMLPVAFGAFVDLSFSKDGGIIRTVWIFSLFWGGVSFLISMTRISHWHLLALAYYPLIAVTGILGLAIPLRLGFHRDQDARIFLIGFAAFFLIASHDYLVGVNVFSYASPTTHFGMFLLVCSIGVILMRRQSRLTQEMAQVSAELDAMQREVEITYMIHLSLFPSHPPITSGLTWAIDYLPSAKVGGDFYDFAENEDGIAILLADVTGHGIPAAVFASGVKMAFALEQKKIHDPAAVLQNMGQSLFGRVGDYFVTACCTFVDLKRGRLTHASAGHMPLLVWKAKDEELISVKPRGRLMGFEHELRCVNAELDLEPGDRIILYTDGLVEAASENREMFGEERLADLIRETASSSIEELRHRLRTRLQEWNGGRLPLEDDLTLLIAQITG